MGQQPDCHLKMNLTEKRVNWAKNFLKTDLSINVNDERRATLDGLDGQASD